MTFDLQAACNIAAKCQSKDPAINHDYWAAHAAQALPRACDEIARQAARIEQLEEENNDLRELVIHFINKFI